MQALHKRAKQYEDDLNKARDEIQKAQLEMKNIDEQVNTFHTKMASSMKSLLKAFTEGFEAMDKAKGDEVAQLQIEKAEREKKRVKKLDKIHSGISGLEALTSKLKLSFNDDAPKPEEHVQTQEDVNVNATKKADIKKAAEPKNATKTEVKKTAAPEKNATKAAATKTVSLKKVTTDNAKAPAKKAATPAKKAETPAKKTVATAQAAKKAPAAAAKKAPAKPAAKSAAAKTPAKSTKTKAKAQPAKKSAKPAKPAAKAAAKPAAKTNAKTNAKTAAKKPAKPAANKANLKAKMQALLSGKKSTPQKKTLSLKKQTLNLAQTASDAEILTKENAEEKLKALLETQQQVKRLTAAIGNNRNETVGNLAKSLGVEVKDEIKNGSNEIIANHLAGKVLAQLSNNKLVQVGDSDDEDDDEQVILEDTNDKKESSTTDDSI